MTTLSKQQVDTLVSYIDAVIEKAFAGQNTMDGGDNSRYDGACDRVAELKVRLTEVLTEEPSVRRKR